ncbi:MAG: N-acetylmuramoyl-L-alanine amidase [Candidatus Omnitrophica bacterium]|jgi:N-acetylmuramoyl-L-alanine amidase|nr:N-acetylmuramoyl-L-alanine amidase [Candidatus Omnitrophota bacterium]
MKKPRLRFWVPALALILMAGCAAPRQQVRQTPAHDYTPFSSTSGMQTQQPFFIPSTDLLPSNVIPEASKSPLYHTVRPKETMWRISQTYHVPMNAILEANNISDARKIKIGQRLLIPGTTATATYNQVMPYLPQADRWRYIVVHHTATRDGNAETINALHLRRGWKEGMGYHFLIDNGTDGRADGEIEAGRRWLRQMDGAHANKSNMNHIGIGISLVGNFSETQISEAQLSSLVQLVKTLQKRYGIPMSNIIGHRNVPGAATECPGNNFPWTRFRQMVEAE